MRSSVIAANSSEPGKKGAFPDLWHQNGHPWPDFSQEPILHDRCFVECADWRDAGSFRIRMDGPLGLTPHDSGFVTRPFTPLLRPGIVLPGIDSRYLLHRSNQSISFCGLAA